MTGIYKVTNQINNKIYIGKSKDIQRRWRQHHTEPFNKNCDAYSVIFYKAIRKYGIEHFSFEVIEECSEEQLNEREKYWIAFYNSYFNNENSSGYNMTRGGENTVFELKYDIDYISQLWSEGATHTEITAKTGCPKATLTNYLNALEIPVEERRYRSNLYKAKPVYQFSYDNQLLQCYTSVSEAVRALQKNNPKVHTSGICYACNGKLTSAYGYRWSYEPEIHSNKTARHTKVNQYDLSGKYIQTFETQSAAKQAIGLKSISSITQACNGVSKTAGGFIWRYYDASLENPIEDLNLENTAILYDKQNNKVDQYDLEGNYITTYSNIADAADAVGLKCKNNIRKACNGEQKTAGGYIWKYNKEHMEVQ